MTRIEQTTQGWQVTYYTPERKQETFEWFDQAAAFVKKLHIEEAVLLEGVDG